MTVDKEFDIGDVVHMKSHSSQRMTVSAYKKNGDKRVLFYCVWFDKDRHLQEGTFAPSMLRVVV